MSTADNQIFVLGPPGAGKSTVCRIAASTLGLSHRTIDEWVHRVYNPVDGSEPMTDEQVDAALSLMMREVNGESGLLEFAYHDYVRMIVLDVFPRFSNARKILLSAPLQVCQARNAYREHRVPNGYLERCWASTLALSCLSADQMYQKADWILIDTATFTPEQAADLIHTFARKNTSANLRKLQIFDNPRKPYVGGYLSDSIEWSDEIVDWIFHRYAIQTVLDVGSGNGMAVERFAARGRHCFGIDAAQASHCAKHSLRERFVCVDLNEQPLVFGPKFDLVWCAEVIEHIPIDGETNVITTLTENAGKVIFLSAAQPGQPGFNHVNCRPKPYWIDKICERGFRQVGEFDLLLPTIPDHGAFGRNDLKHNSILFERT